VDAFFRGAARLRTAARKAWAKSASVMLRYHAPYCRTSYSSSPTSCFASSKPCSMAQRVPATRTTSASVAGAGAKTT
jgi:hypothetical protein